MIKILFAALNYPLSMSSYLREALEHRSDVELWTTGPFFNDWLPWGTWGKGMHLPMKYVRPVDFALPTSLNYPNWSVVKSQLPWRPDLVLQIDANFHFSDKPDCFTATVATDPHCLQYNVPRAYSDKFFNMQKFYSQPNDIYLPYAFSPRIHYPDPTVTVDSDACLVGVHYPERNALVKMLRDKKLNIIYELGPIFDEYRQLNCRAKIGLNWSSQKDICARVLEIMGMKRIPVINRVPDLSEMGLVENIHYLGFDGLRDACEKVDYALSHPEESAIIAENAYQKVWKEDTWDLRAEQILKDCGLIGG
jgi:hypothetical protein